MNSAPWVTEALRRARVGATTAPPISGVRATQYPFSTVTVCTSFLSAIEGLQYRDEPCHCFQNKAGVPIRIGRKGDAAKRHGLAVGESPDPKKCRVSVGAPFRRQA